MLVQRVLCNADYKHGDVTNLQLELNVVKLV